MSGPLGLSISLLEARLQRSAPAPQLERELDRNPRPRGGKLVLPDLLRLQGADFGGRFDWTLVDRG